MKDILCKNEICCWAVCLCLTDTDCDSSPLLLPLPRTLCSSRAVLSDHFTLWCLHAALGAKVERKWNGSAPPKSEWVEWHMRVEARASTLRRLISVSNRVERTCSQNTKHYPLLTIPFLFCPTNFSPLFVSHALYAYSASTHLVSSVSILHYSAMICLAILFRSGFYPRGCVGVASPQ